MCYLRGCIEMAIVNSRKIKSLNKKEKGKLLEELRCISGVQLLDVVIKKLSAESHMQFYPEREQLLLSVVKRWLQFVLDCMTILCVPTYTVIKAKISTHDFKYSGISLAQNSYCQLNTQCLVIVHHQFDCGIHSQDQSPRRFAIH